MYREAVGTGFKHPRLDLTSLDFECRKELSFVNSLSPITSCGSGTDREEANQDVLPSPFYQIPTEATTPFPKCAAGPVP